MVVERVYFKDPPSSTGRILDIGKDTHTRQVGSDKPDEEVTHWSSGNAGGRAQGRQPYLVKPKLFRNPKKIGEARTRIRTEAPQNMNIYIHITKVGILILATLL